MEVRRFWWVPHVERHGAELALLIALAALLELAAGVGLAYVAGRFADLGRGQSARMVALRWVPLCLI
jgi:hypothetical protein